jgi:hypothetical protein
VVGFFPPVTQDQIDGQEGVSEGLAHLEFALADTLKCLKEAGVLAEAEVVLARSIVVLQDGHRERFTLPTSWPAAVGAYLLKPGKAPLVVYAEAGPSSLTMLVPDAAAGFFAAATCKEPWNR